VTPLFVFCADLHLVDGAWSSRPAIYGDSYYSFEQIVDYCIEHNLPMIMGGDILEKKQNLARPIAKLCAGLSRMQVAKVPVYYIQGNHEYDRNAPWLSVHEWPIHIHGMSWRISDTKVYGLDWLPRGEIQEAFTQVPADTEILITHQVWKDLMGNVGRPECELTDVHHVQTVLAGDFHITKTVESTNAQGQPIKMLSPGSTCMQDIGEVPEKSFFVVGRIPTTGNIVFTQLQLQTRKFLGYTVKDQETLDRLCAGEFIRDIQAAETATLPEEIRKPLLRVKFDKRLPDAHLRITTAVGEAAHLFCDAIVDKTRGEEETSRAVTKNDLVLTLEELLREAPESLQVAMLLLNSDSPAAELEKHFTVFQAKEEKVDATATARSQELVPAHL
jgi:hypothetical protein